FQAEDGIRDGHVTGVQTCALPICSEPISAILWPASGDPGFQENFGMISQRPSTISVPPGRYYACAFVSSQPWMLMQNGALRKARSEERRVGKEGTSHRLRVLGRSG